jgi:hypothetical protein
MSNPLSSFACYPSSQDLLPLGFSLFFEIDVGIGF